MGVADDDAAKDDDADNCVKDCGVSSHLLNSCFGVALLVVVDI